MGRLLLFLATVATIVVVALLGDSDGSFPSVCAPTATQARTDLSGGHGAPAASPQATGAAARPQRPDLMTALKTLYETVREGSTLGAPLAKKSSGQSAGEPPPPNPPAQPTGVAAPPISPRTRQSEWFVSPGTVWVPPLQIEWESTEHIARVARILGLRVFAVDGAGRITGELRLDSRRFRLEPVSFSGMPRLSGRIRALEHGVFAGYERAPGIDGHVAEWWVCIPVEIDRGFQKTQLDVLRAHTLAGKPAEVRAMKGRLVIDGRTCRLAIGEIVLSTGAVRRVVK